uniref:mitogen-activated protein kinase kinase n=1 Tax=Acrobeloides nanus TaxID=290746 RepID=A0A914D1N1_9BILA
MRRRGAPRFGSGGIVIPEPPPPPNVPNLDDKFVMKLDNGNEIEIDARELDRIRELGRGAYGVVEEMIHRPTGMIFAVKRIHSSINDESQKRMSVELEAMKSGCCEQMVRFFGAMFREGDVWICMEVMDVSLDKFYRMNVDLHQRLPEPFLAKVALAVIEGLNFMKEKMELIHRDIKPSNILLNRQGAVKICDFGISGHLTNSVAKTVNAGCKPYMPPERIDGESKNAYGVQADVWSLGITLVEISTGTHPYGRWKTPFEQLKQVVQEPPPKVDRSIGYSDEFHDFIAQCLIKNFVNRPKHTQLLKHPFLVKAKNDTSFNMGEFISSVLRVEEVKEEKFLQNLNMNGE